MPHRLLPYRTSSFVGFIGIFLFAVVALASLPVLGPVEMPVRGLAWLGVIAAALLMGRAWWNLAPEIFGSRMPLGGFVLLVFFVAWVWVWFAIVLVKCEGRLSTCGPWRIALDVGALAMWGTLAWVVWWRTRQWLIAALVLIGNFFARAPIYVPAMRPGTRALGVIVLSAALILALVALFRSAHMIDASHMPTAHTLFQAHWFRVTVIVATAAVLFLLSLSYLVTWLSP